MDCRTTDTQKIVSNLHIGRVLFIVEGNVDEPKLIRKIFRDVFGMRCARIGRTGEIEVPMGGEISEYRSKDNSDIVYIIQAKSSNLGTLVNGRNYIESIFNAVREQYKIRLDTFLTFYLFDRDHGTNTNAQLVRGLLTDMSDPYESTGQDSLKGLLLLSYPCSQSYVLSCFEDNCYGVCASNSIVYGNQLKNYLTSKRYKISGIDKKCIIHALEEFGTVISDYAFAGPDDIIGRMAESNGIIFDDEEAYFQLNGSYGAFSTISIVLYYLSIVAF